MDCLFPGDAQKIMKIMKLWKLWNYGMFVPGGWRKHYENYEFMDLSLLQGDLKNYENYGIMKIMIIMDLPPDKIMEIMKIMKNP